MEYKIKSPKTNRYIYVHGDVYNELMSKHGYTQEYLSSLPQIKAEKPMSPKYKKVNKPNHDTVYLTRHPDTDLQLLYHTNDIYSLCQTNKHLYNLCMNNQNIKEKYLKQQKIHKRLNNLFDFLSQNNNVIIYFRYDSKKIITNFNNLFYYSPTFMDAKTDTYLATLFIVSKNKKLYIPIDPYKETTYEHITKITLYDNLFLTLNEYEPIKIQFYGKTKRSNKTLIASNLIF